MGNGYVQYKRAAALTGIPNGFHQWSQGVAAEEPPMALGQQHAEVPLGCAKGSMQGGEKSARRKKREHLS